MGCVGCVGCVGECPKAKAFFARAPKPLHRDRTAMSPSRLLLRSSVQRVSRVIDVVGVDVIVVVVVDIDVVVGGNDRAVSSVCRAPAKAEAPASPRLLSRRSMCSRDKPGLHSSFASPGPHSRESWLLLHSNVVSLRICNKQEDSKTSREEKVRPVVLTLMLSYESINVLRCSASTKNKMSSV